MCLLINIVSDFFIPDIILYFSTRVSFVTLNQKHPALVVSTLLVKIRQESQWIWNSLKCLGLEVRVSTGTHARILGLLVILTSSS